MVFWAVISDEIKQAIDFFPNQEEAEETLRRVLELEPDWREVLRIERLELGTESPN
jgi:hypothetical protein